MLGADRVLFGTDVPGFDPAENLRAVLAARLSEDDKRRVLSGNGEAILSRKRTTAST